MRILQTPPTFYPHVGGLENAVYYVSRELVKRGHDVEVICANRPKVANSMSIDGITVSRLDYVGRIANTPITPSLPYRLLKSDFDVIHTTMPTPWSADWSNVIAAVKKKPLVLTIQNDIGGYDFVYNMLTRLYCNTFYRALLKYADMIIMVNPGWESLYINTRRMLSGYEDKIKVIPNGVDPDIFRPGTRGGEGGSILTVAVLDEFHKFKGLDYLIDAMPMVIDKIQKACLTIIGSGNMEEYYETMVKKRGLEGHVNFAGHIPHTELPKFYNKSDVFVLPSIGLEGLPLVLLEAMACCTPVITTDVAGISRFILDYNSGLVVSSGDSKALAESIVGLLSETKRAREMGKNGRGLVEEKFTWSRICEEIEMVYQEVSTK